MTTPPSLLHRLRQLSAERPDSLAYEFTDRGHSASLTYRQLEERVAALANRLAETGPQESPVLLLLPAGLDFIASFLAVLALGVPAIPLPAPNRRQGLAHLEHIVRLCGAGRAVMSRGLAAQRSAWPPAVAALAALVPDEAAAAAGCRLSTTSSQDPQAAAFLQFTSGSTRTPRGARITHANLMANLAQIADVFGLGPQDRGVFWLPPHHDMGLVGGLLGGLHAGVPIHFFSPAQFLLNPLLWLRELSRRAATISGAPDFAYRLCARRAERDGVEGLDLSHWRTAFVGADTIRPSTLDWFTRLFAPVGFSSSAFLTCYGLAEATLLVSGGRRRRVLPLPENLPAGDLSIDRGITSCGAPATGLDLRIVDPASAEPLPADRIGEIWVAGPSVADGYCEDGEETAGTFGARCADGSGPYLRTGDLGFLNDGELFVCGRLKDLILIRGRNFFAQDLEAALLPLHPDLASEALVVLDRPGAEETALVAVQEVPARFTGDLAALGREANRRMAEEAGLFVHELVLVKSGSLPRTTSGKLQRPEIRRRLMAGSLARLVGAGEDDRERGACPFAGIQPRGSEVRAAAAQLLGRAEEDVGLDRPLAELGFDSLRLVELKLSIDAAFGIDLPLAVLESRATLADVNAEADRLRHGADRAPPTPRARLEEPATAPRAPGPRESGPHGSMAGFQDSPTDFLCALAREHGAVARFTLNGHLFHSVSEPEEVRRVFGELDTFIKGESWRGSQVTMGLGLLHADGEAWAIQRRIAAPLFTPLRVEAYAEGIEAAADRWVETRLAGEPFALLPALQDLTLELILHVLFGRCDPAVHREIAPLLRSLGRALDVPAFYALGDGNAEYKDLLGRWWASIARIVEEDGGAAPPDSVFGRWRDSEHVSRLAPDQCRGHLADMLATMLVAGYDTTSVILCWAVMHLVQSPEYQDAIRLDGSTDSGDLASPMLTAVLHETLRLHPPGWFVVREVARDTELRGYPVQAGSCVVASAYVVHRSPWLWPEPEQFRPARFLDSRAAQPTGRYFPFGLGRRLCVGMPLAMMEMRQILGALLRRAAIEPVGAVAMEPGRSFILSPARPPQVRLRSLARPASIPAVAVTRRRRECLLFGFPAAGHVGPSLALIRAMSERGDRVSCVGTDPFRDRIAAAGAAFLPYPATPIAPLESVLRREPPLGVVATQVLQSTAELADWASDLVVQRDADVVLFDSWSPWGDLAGRARRRPTACLTTTFALPRAMLKVLGIEAQLGQADGLLDRAEAALGALSAWWEEKGGPGGMPPWLGAPLRFMEPQGDRTLVCTSSLFQFAAGAFDDRVIFLGHMFDPTSSGVSADIEAFAAAGQRVAYLSLGTIYNRDPEIFRRCCAVLVRQGWRVIVSIDEAAAPALAGFGSAIMARPWLPQRGVLRRVGLFVTHAGMNGVAEAIEAGVPMILLPQSVDQPLVARRVEQLGCGLTLPKGSWSDEDLEAALRQIADGADAMHAALDRVRQSFLAGPGAAGALATIDGLRAGLSVAAS